MPLPYLFHFQRLLGFFVCLCVHVHPFHLLQTTALILTQLCARTHIRTDLHTLLLSPLYSMFSSVGIA